MRWSSTVWVEVLPIPLQFEERTLDIWKDGGGKTSGTPCLGTKGCSTSIFCFHFTFNLRVDRSTTREATSSSSEPTWGSLVILLGSEEIGVALPLMWEAVGETISAVRAFGRAFGTSAEGPISEAPREI